MYIREIKLPQHKDPEQFNCLWEVTTNCSYRCRYCAAVKEEKFQEVDSIIEAINYIATKKKMHLTLFGGEAVMHPDFFQILDELKVSSLQVHTNLSKSKSFWDKVARTPNIEIIISYHPCHVDRDEFTEKVLALIKTGIIIKLIVMLDLNYREECLDLFNFFEKLESKHPNLKLSISKIFEQTLDSKDIEWYLEQQVGREDIIVFHGVDSITKKYTQESYLVNNNLNNFRLFKCDAGMRTLVISSEGKFFACSDYRSHNISFTNSKDTGWKEKLEFISEKGVLCRIDKCLCGCNIPKKRII